MAPCPLLASRLTRDRRARRLAFALRARRRALLAAAWLGAYLSPLCLVLLWPSLALAIVAFGYAGADIRRCSRSRRMAAYRSPVAGCSGRIASAPGSTSGRGRARCRRLSPIADGVYLGPLSDRGGGRSLQGGRRPCRRIRAAERRDLWLGQPADARSGPPQPEPLLASARAIETARQSRPGAGLLRARFPAQRQRRRAMACRDRPRARPRRGASGARAVWPARASPHRHPSAGGRLEPFMVTRKHSAGDGWDKVEGFGEGRAGCPAETRA